MTPETTADNLIDPLDRAPSTAGMTTRVFKGSIWMLAALGCGLVASQQELLKLDLRLDTYKPAMPAATRKLLVDRWHKAVKRSLGWAA